jgi:hypothetical protein
MSEIKCSYCRHTFPDGLVEELMLADHGGTLGMPACPVCALKWRNEIAGLHPETPFEKELAQRMFRQAVAHLGINAPRWAYNIANGQKAPASL